MPDLAGLEVVLPAAPHDAGARLLEFLGVTWTVDPRLDGRVCAGCGAALAGLRADARFCSTRCRRRAHEKTRTRVRYQGAAREGSSRASSTKEDPCVT